MWARKLKWKAVFAFAMFLCCMSIVYSGTRGAMIAGLLYVFMCMRSMKRLVLSVVTASVVVLLLYFTLPPDLHYRYFGFLSAEEQEEVGEDVAALQSGSATSRIRGLVDGWRIMMRFPVAGVGPGGSQFARNMVNEKITEQSNIQLHNLYGQVMAETGIPGTLLFAVIAGTCFFLVPTATGETGLGTRFCKLALGAWLVYGMAGHTLYDLKWVILYALFDACSAVAGNAPAESLPAASPQETGGG
jgi:O-antigen ligase